MNPFNLLGIQQDFAIDVEQLEKNYLSLQKKIHPDCLAEKHFTGASESLSAELNKAYKILKDPVQRAQTLLQLHSTSLEEQDLDLLQEMLELREQADPNQLKIMYEKYLNDLEGAFMSNDYVLAKNYYLKLNYINKALQNVITDY